MYKLFISFLLFVSVTLHASVLDSLVTFEKKEYSIAELLNHIDEMNFIHLSYQPNLIDLSARISPSETSMKVSALLNEMFFGTSVHYKLVSKQLILYANSDNNTYILYGRITDKLSGERLIGATLINESTNTGVATNHDGNYGLELSAGYYKIMVRYIGYKTISKIILINKDTQQNFELQPSIDIEEVKVYGEESISDHFTNMKLNLPSKKIDQLPLSFGEADVLKTIQLVPGVQSGMEGTSGIYVRGGEMGHNQILIDGVPIYHAGHMLGIYSLVNNASIQKATLLKGGFSARYGGATSSYLNIDLKEGNNKEHHQEFGIGLLTGSILAEGPMKNGKGSYLVAARRTFYDLITMPIAYMIQPKGEREYINYHFGDYQAKLTYNINQKNKLTLSLFNASDRFKRLSNWINDYDNNQDDILHKLKWASTALSVSWINQSAKNTQIKTTLSYHQYILKQHKHNRLIYTDTIRTIIPDTDARAQSTDINIKSDVEHYISNKLNVNWGGECNYSLLMPNVTGMINYDPEGNIFPVEPVSNSQSHFLFQFTSYGEMSFKPSNRIYTNFGLRTSITQVENKSYISTEPRFFARFSLTKSSSVFAAYDRTMQNKNLLSNTYFTLPTDLWIPVSKNIKPLIANQVSGGYHHNFNNRYRITLEGYYKLMNNVLGLNAYGIATNYDLDWGEKIESGKGKAYGFEILAEKTRGKLSSWVSYTYSRAFRQIENLNFGKPFPYIFDKPHVIQCSFIYKPSKKIALSAVWLFANGMRYNYADYTYNRLGEDYFYEYSNSGDLQYYNELNQLQYPNYQRLDLGFEHKKYKKNKVRIWKLGIYNTYMHYNPFYLTTYEGTMFAVAPFKFLPFFKYTVKF